MDELRAMRVFVRVAERGGFGAAAADLGLSRGMASAVIKEVEARLGVELIRRTTRRMALTQDGLAYLERARAILDEVEALHERMAGTRERVEGRVTLQVPTAFSRLILAPSMGGFLDRYPGLQMVVHAQDRFPDMVAEGIDVLLYVAPGPLADSGLVARSLGRFPLLAVATPEYLAAHGVPKTPEDLAGHRLIDIHSATTGRTLQWQFDLGGRQMLRPATGAVTFDSSEAAVAAALGGAGILMNISYALAEHVAAGRLVRVLREFQDPGPMLFVVTRRHARLPARLTATIEHLTRLTRERRARDAEILG